MGKTDIFESSIKDHLNNEGEIEQYPHTICSIFNINPNSIKIMKQCARKRPISIHKLINSLWKWKNKEDPYHLQYIYEAQFQKGASFTLSNPMSQSVNLVDKELISPESVLNKPSSKRSKITIA